MTRFSPTRGGYDTSEVGGGEKPYRVYRGGRATGAVPLAGRKPAPQAEKRVATGGGNGAKRYAGPGPAKPRRRWRARRYVLLGLLVLVVLGVLWGIGTYFALAGGDKAAQGRLGDPAKAALDKEDGLLLSNTTDILVLGTDHSQAVGRSADRHSDSIMLIRIGGGRTVFLSIPRDLRVDIPGHGPDKINAAMQLGGPALAIKTLRTYTTLPVNHVVVLDFSGFKSLIDKVGGVRVNVPAAVYSDKFDCPFSARRCETWKGWRFAKGPQTMNGARALVYSRIRVNRLNAADSDITRGSRQQAVLQALKAKLLGPATLLQLPFMGGSLLDPVATDLSAGELVQLIAMMKTRGGSTLHCRLGGTLYGSGQILPNEEDVAVINEVRDPKAAPTPPNVASYGLYAPGCSSKNLS
jgi:LCP family protein required for cell wall assembly